jgi:hypothetical protein
MIHESWVMMISRHQWSVVQPTIAINYLDFSVNNVQQLLRMQSLESIVSMLALHNFIAPTSNS